MSPAQFHASAPPAVDAAVQQIWSTLGQAIRAERQRRGWSVPRLAASAGLSRTTAYLVERGQPGSLEVAVRLAMALALRLDLVLTDPRRRDRSLSRLEDPVHAAMGEFEAAHLRRLGMEVGIDEPYQHYQFAGRADLVAWTRSPAALLHLENRTRFPNMQEMAGSWNAKRAYLAASLGQRLGIRFGAVTHVMVAAWTSEVLHSMRLHPGTFGALAPDPPSAFDDWWNGRPPAHGSTSSMIVLDPLATGRLRLWVDLATALEGVRPRHRGYTELVTALMETRRTERV
jgi:transcriptional regulator with XRE-family HTH domain